MSLEFPSQKTIHPALLGKIRNRPRPAETRRETSTKPVQNSDTGRDQQRPAKNQHQNPSGWIIASSKRRPLVRFSFPRVFVDAASCAISSVPAASSGFECPGGCKRGGPSKWGHGPFSCFVSAFFCRCSESFPVLVYYSIYINILYKPVM